jgi:pyridoxal/pyridoxine/pyridoxamine kinase
VYSASPVRYVCDPVLGDHDQYYVPEGLVNIFRTQLLPRYGLYRPQRSSPAERNGLLYLYRSYMITPNQFEAELLSGNVTM